MVSTLEAGFRRGRVWLGELPLVMGDIPGKTHEVLALVGTTITPLYRKAAIELYIPRGGFVSYGLLGVEFIASNSGSLAVQVLSCDAPGPFVPLSLAAKVDKVFVGLPQEMTESVLAGALRALESAGPGTGTLRFTCAAHGQVGSSPAIFKRLSETVVRLLSVTPEELAKVVNL